MERTIQFLKWARKENLNEMFNLSHAINIIDWKIRNKVPRGEAVCKKIDVSENECPWYTPDPGIQSL